MDKEYIATPAETVAQLLKAGGRRAGASVPVRRSLVQLGTQAQPEPGALAHLVRNGDRRGLDLYLLLKAVASAAPFNSHRGAGVWARALRHTGVSASEQTVSKIWRRLDEMSLVHRGRDGRLADITLLNEDGSGRRYVHPADNGDAYFQIPVSYWTNGPDHWCGTLSLSGKAVLLIALSLKPGFILPIEKAPNWYGLSADTAQRGLSELRRRGAISRQRIPRKAPLSPQGFTTDSRYTLPGDFARLEKPGDGT